MNSMASWITSWFVSGDDSNSLDTLSKAVHSEFSSYRSLPFLKHIMWSFVGFPFMFILIDLDLDSTRIQVDALGHTPTPF